MCLLSKKENESDLDVWVEERAERTFNNFHQYVAENLDSSLQLTPELSTQIWKEKVVGEAHKTQGLSLWSRLSKRCKTTPVRLRRNWIITSSRGT
ncbi:hypothetical protein MTR67_045175 [Solanum verrucosum]|uniref:Uncharacterized protein n=1 Tax=Solanum verrucosum TaxID=315347 RepID=A0AAF0US69_SOLVR|nr:hypothetical protein MTR67_045175 [Solanum verrucosum]